MLWCTRLVWSAEGCSRVFDLSRTQERYRLSRIASLNTRMYYFGVTWKVVDRADGSRLRKRQIREIRRIYDPTWSHLFGSAPYCCLLISSTVIPKRSSFRTSLLWMSLESFRLEIIYNHIIQKQRSIDFMGNQNAFLLQSLWLSISDLCNGVTALLDLTWWQWPRQGKDWSLSRLQVQRVDILIQHKYFHGLYTAGADCN